MRGVVCWQALALADDQQRLTVEQEAGRLMGLLMEKYFEEAHSLSVFVSTPGRMNMSICIV